MTTLSFFGRVTWQKTLTQDSQAHALTIFMPLLLLLLLPMLPPVSVSPLARRTGSGAQGDAACSLQLADKCDECAGACGARLGAIRHAFLGARAANKKCCKGKLPPDHFL
jgi:hypothetical protein